MPNVMVSNLLVPAIIPALTITTSSPLPAATVGVAYSTTVAASGGVPPYAWSILASSPDTAAINAATGVLGYTPATAGTESVGVGVADAVLHSTNKTFTLPVSAASGWNPPSPLLASYRIGGGDGQKYGADWQNWVLPQALPMMNAQYMVQSSGGFTAIAGYTKQSVANFVRAHSTVPGGPKLGQYTLFDTNHNATTPFVTHADASGWVLRDTSGNVIAGWDGGTEQYNSCPNVPTDSNGFMLEDYGASFSDINFRTNAGGQGAQGANNCWNPDFFYHDNFFKQARSGAANYLNNGVNQSPSTTAAATGWRTGLLRFVTQLKKTFPSAIILGNLDGPANEGSFNGLTEYAPVSGNINGGFLEGGMGIFFAPSSFANLKSEILFRKQVAGSVTPNIVVMGVLNLSATGQLPTAYSSNNPSAFSPNWQGSRYAIGVALLFNVFIAWTPDNGSYLDDTGLTTYDEFGGQTAQYPSGYLGHFVSGPTTLANGVQVSIYTNGLVAVNPGANGTQATALNQTMLTSLGVTTAYRLRGVQDPSFNTAAQVTNANPLALSDSGAYCGDAAVLMFAPQ